jgi:hypothetical protein
VITEHSPIRELGHRVFPRPSPTDDETDYRKAALRRCEMLIKNYEKYSLRAWRYYTGFQVATLVLAGLTPFLLLYGSGVPQPIQALPSALAALAAGINAVFHSREDAIRQRITRELLKSERAKFLTRTSPRYGTGVSDAKALDHFVCRIEELTINEVLKWGTREKEAAVEEQQPLPQTDRYASPRPAIT